MMMRIGRTKNRMNHYIFEWAEICVSSLKSLNIIRICTLIALVFLFIDRLRHLHTINVAYIYVSLDFSIYLVAEYLAYLVDSICATQ